MCLKKCCCCLEMRSGGLLYAVLATLLYGGKIALSYFSLYHNYGSNESMINTKKLLGLMYLWHLIGSVMGLMALLLLITAIIRMRHFLFIPHFIAQVVEMIGLTIVLILLIVNYASGAYKEANKKVLNWIIVYVVFHLIFQMYYFLCIRVLHRRIKTFYYF